jgi:hypothetical protein
MQHHYPKAYMKYQGETHFLVPAAAFQFPFISEILHQTVLVGQIMMMLRAAACPDMTADI